MGDVLNIQPGYYRTLYEQDKKLYPAVIWIDNNTIVNHSGGVKYRRFQYMSNGIYVLTSVKKKK